MDNKRIFRREILEGSTGVRAAKTSSHSERVHYDTQTNYNRVFDGEHNFAFGKRNIVAHPIEQRAKHHGRIVYRNGIRQFAVIGGRNGQNNRSQIAKVCR
jgi:hypothetical protein